MSLQKNDSETSKKSFVSYAAFDLYDDSTFCLLAPSLVLKTLQFLQYMNDQIQNTYSNLYRNIISYFEIPQINTDEIKEIISWEKPSQYQWDLIYFMKHNITSLDMMYSNILNQVVNFDLLKNSYSTSNYQYYIDLYSAIFKTINLNQNSYSIFDSSNIHAIDEQKRLILVFGNKIWQNSDTLLKNYTPFAFIAYYHFLYVIIQKEQNKYETYGIPKRTFDDIESIKKLHGIIGIIYLRDDAKPLPKPEERKVTVYIGNTTVEEMTTKELFSRKGKFIIDYTDKYSFKQYPTTDEYLNEYMELPLESSINNTGLKENYSPFIFYKQIDDPLDLKFDGQLITCMPAGDCYVKKFSKDPLPDDSRLCIVKDHHIIDCYHDDEKISFGLGSLVLLKVIELSKSKESKIFWVQFVDENKQFIHCPLLIKADKKSFERDFDLNSLKKAFPPQFANKTIKRIFGFKAFKKVQLISKNPFDIKKLSVLHDYIVIYTPV